MFKKKGFIMAFILIISMIGMTACKKNVGAPEDNAQAEENEDETNTEEPQEHLIGFSVIDMENPYFITLESAAKAELEEDGYRMITKNPETDPQLQETQIQEMIDEGKDIEVKCHFCNTAYNYTVEDLKNILKRSKK